VAALAILAIVLLGVDSVIDKATVSALLGSLFGYVLGSASHSSQNGGTKPTTPTGTGTTPSGAAPDAGQSPPADGAPPAAAGDQPAEAAGAQAPG
jgi:hypothetical protein